MKTNLQQILIPFAREIDVTLENTKRYIANKHIDISALGDAAEDELMSMRAMMLLGDSLSEDLPVYPKHEAHFIFYNGRVWFIPNYNRSYLRQRNAADLLSARLQSHLAADPVFQQGYLSFEVEGDYYFYLAIDLPEGGVFGCWFSTDALLEELRGSIVNGLSIVMFADKNGNMLNEQFNTRSARRMDELLSGYLVVREQLLSAPFSLVALLDRDIVFAPFMRLNQVILFALITALVLLVIYIASIYGSIIRPLTRLIASIKNIQKGNFQSILVRKNDAMEIQDVYDALNTMTQEVETLKIRVYEEKLMRQNTRMQLFQLQLRPHFFLNALNTILSYARANDYAMLQKMTLGLAAHCRYILYNNWFVSVEEELNYTQNYIDMQSMQHDTRYHYVARVEEALLDQEVPILTLQIFVENALKHSRDHASEIDITASIARIHDNDTDYLLIEICDTGIGFSDQMLSSLNSSVEEQMPADGEHGIGIENVRKRLEILYGNQATILFANNQYGGACVTMRLPMERRRKRA